MAIVHLTLSSLLFLILTVNTSFASDITPAAHFMAMPSKVCHDNKSNGGVYKEPSPVLKRLLVPPKFPTLTLSADQKWLVFCSEPPIPSIEYLAKPEEKLAGIRFDPVLKVPSGTNFATDITIQELTTGIRHSFDLPEDFDGIRYIKFNPNPSAVGYEQQFVFASKGEKKLMLYVCNLTKTTKDDGSVVYTWHPPQSVESFNNDFALNFIEGCAYKFSSDGTRLLCNVVPQEWPEEAPETPISTGPAIRFVPKGARRAPGRTYQDLLRNAHDEDKLRYFLTTEIVSVNLEPGHKPIVIDQSKGGKMIRDFQCSPSGRFLLVELITTFSYSVCLERFGKDFQLWDMETGAITDIVSIPIDDEIPLANDACSRHPRCFQFHPLEDHTILFAHARDGGDPKEEPKNGERDALYTQILIPDETATWKLQTPVKFLGLEWRFEGISFGRSGFALVDEYRWKDRMRRKWLLDRVPTEVADDELNINQKSLMWERCWEDRYTCPGEPVTRLGPQGQRFIVEPSPNKIYLKGIGGSPLGDRPFLDEMDLDTHQKKRLWRCKPPKDGVLDPSLEVGGKIPKDRQDVFETLHTLMDDNVSMLITRESKTTPRNYYLKSLDNSFEEITVTNFPHPQPDLLGVSRELVHYQRKDGVELTANLYLPKDYDGTPRPTLFWAYPREFKNSKAAGQIKFSKHRFLQANWGSPVHWAAKGWVIMDGFSMPIIGEGDHHPNDSFIEQIVMGATAAVEYATSLGVCDPSRCAVGGHSYGSFMTAHLLAQTSLFAAGISRSGAFNRLLTPMSFQSEDRSLWEAQDIYINMSPLIHVKHYSEQDRVGKLLLIHGEEDENCGTFPLQSERYFAALKAFGIESRLVMMPHEGHHYKAKESILHMTWEQEQWLKPLERTNFSKNQ